MTRQYRRAVKSDFAAIVDLFVQNMNLSVFTRVTDEHALRQLATLFLAKDFHSATFMQVAEYDGIVCGIIIGITKYDSHRALRFDENSVIKQAKETLRLSEQGRQVLSDLQTKDRQVKDMQIKDMQIKDTSETEEEKEDFDSKLQFFCVDHNYRRHRIGAKLIQAFEDYLIARGATAYALHTDTLCTYQYYDNNGYQRVAHYPNHLNPQIEHYTYTKVLSE